VKPDVDLTKFVTPSMGATGILVLVVLLILWGKLVPKAVLDDMRSDKDKQIETWKDAYHRSEEARAVQAGQITTLMEVARTTEHVIGALPAAAGFDGSNDANAVAQE
jgi:hypothetical protein